MNVKRQITVLLILLSVVFNLNVATAQETDLPKMRIKAAGFASTSLAGIDYNGVPFNPGGGFGPELGFEYNIIKGLGIEFNALYRTVNSYTLEEYNNVFKKEQKVEFSTTSFELNARYRFTFNKEAKVKSHIYGGFGLGYYLPSDLHRTYTESFVDGNGDTNISESEDLTVSYKSSLGAQFSIGYELSVARKVGFTTGMRMRLVTFNASQTITENESRIFMFLDPLESAGIDFFLGVLFYL